MATTQYSPERFKNTKKHPNDAHGSSLRLRYQVETATYGVRCTCIRRSVYVRTAIGVRAYDVRCTSPSGQQVMMKQA